MFAFKAFFLKVILKKRLWLEHVSKVCSRLALLLRFYSVSYVGAVFGHFGALDHISVALLDWSEIWYSWLLFWSSWGLSGLAGALLLGLLVSAAAFWGFLALSGGFLGLSWGFMGSSGVSCDFCVLAL